MIYLLKKKNEIFEKKICHIFLKQGIIFKNFEKILYSPKKLYPSGYNFFKNCGYKIFIDGEKILYATDTNNLNGITAPDYDLYMIEANYEDEEIQERIRKKEESGSYAYEYKVLKSHLSKAKCDDFIVRNAGTKSKFIYMHGHIKEE